MRSRWIFRGGIFAAIVCLLLLAGCGDSDPIIPPPGFDAENDAGGSGGSGGDAGFTKPSSSASWEDPRKELAEQPVKESGMVIRRFINARPHMHANQADTEYWLYEDEPAVFDAAIRVDGIEEAVVFDLFVFVDFEPVRFGHIALEADPQAEALPTLQKASAATAVSPKTSFEVEPNAPAAFTLVIPPESLGKAAAHDVRLVMVARPTPTTEHPVAWPMGTSKKAIINFGATEFSAASTLDTEIISPPAHIAPLIGGTGVFVEPPRELHDLADVEAFRTDAKTAQLFETSADSVRLSGWAQSASEGASNVFLAAMVDDELLEHPRGQLMLPKPVSSYNRESYPRYAAELDIEVALEDDQPHLIRLMRFEQPFSREPHSRTSVSNAIFIRKVEE